MGHLTTNNPLSRIIIYSHICCSVWDLKNISPLSSICYCFLQHHRCITVSTRLRSRQVGLHYCHSCISSEYDNFTPCISHCCADKTQQKMSLGAFCSEVGLAVPAVIPLHQHMLHLHQGVQLASRGSVGLSLCLGALVLLQSVLSFSQFILSGLRAYDSKSVQERATSSRAFSDAFRAGWHHVETT